MSQGSLKAHASLFFVNALYAASHLIAKGVMPAYLSPNVFIAMRVVGATTLFWIIKHSFFAEIQIDKKDFVLLAFCGLFGVAINQLFFFHGLNLSSSINSGIIMTLNPIMVSILAFFLLKESFTLLKTIGILLGATGAVLLTLTAGTGVGDSLLGDAFLFINALSYALFLVLVKPLMVKYSPLVVITYVFTFGTAFVLLFPPTWIDLLQTNFSTIPSEIWLKIAYVIIGVTFLAYLLTVFSLKQLSASVSSTYIYFQPVLVILFAFLFAKTGLSEDYTKTISFEKVMYMILIFIGVSLVVQPKRAKLKN